jgi:hypothetical protein
MPVQIESLGSIVFYESARFAFHRSNVAAQLLAGSIIYPPAVFVLLLLDKK